MWGGTAVPMLSRGAGGVLPRCMKPARREMEVLGKAIPADIRSAEKNTSSLLHNPFGLGGAVRQGDAQQIDARHEARQIDVGRGAVGGGGEQPFNQFL